MDISESMESSPLTAIMESVYVILASLLMNYTILYELMILLHQHLLMLDSFYCFIFKKQELGIPAI